eukprot:1144350-Pelagomonas_calceolata.AAC.5
MYFVAGTAVAAAAAAFLSAIAVVGRALCKQTLRLNAMEIKPMKRLSVKDNKMGCFLFQGHGPARDGGEWFAG